MFGPRRTWNSGADDLPLKPIILRANRRRASLQPLGKKNFLGNFKDTPPSQRFDREAGALDCKIKELAKAVGVWWPRKGERRKIGLNDLIWFFALLFA